MRIKSVGILFLHTSLFVGGSDLKISAWILFSEREREKGRDWGQKLPAGSVLRPNEASTGFSAYFYGLINIELPFSYSINYVIAPIKPNLHFFSPSKIFLLVTTVLFQIYSSESPQGTSLMLSLMCSNIHVKNQRIINFDIDIYVICYSFFCTFLNMHSKSVLKHFSL